MIIDFSKLDRNLIDNFKGGEKRFDVRWHVDDNNRIMLGRLEPGASIGMHTHDTSCEMIYILSGRGTALIDGGSESVEAGQCHYCPKGSTHSLVNSGSEELTFFAVVPQQ